MQAGTILFIPCVSITLRSLFCGFDTHCHGGMAEQALGLSAAAAFLAMTLCYSAFLFDNDGQQAWRFSLSRSPARVEILSLAIQAAVTACFHIATLKSSHLALALLYTIGTLAIAALYTWYLPYLNQRIMTLRVVISWIHAWAGVSLMLCVLMDDRNDRTGPLLLYLSAPLVGVLAVVSMSSRRMAVSQKDLEDLSDAYEVRCLLSASLAVSAYVSNLTIAF